MVFPNYFFPPLLSDMALKKSIIGTDISKKKKKNFTEKTPFSLIVATVVLPTVSPCKATWKDTLQEKNSEDLRFKSLV